MSTAIYLSNTNSVHPYYLLSQYTNGLLVIGIRGKSICLRRTAVEVLVEPRLLAGLSAEDKALIESIANNGSINKKLRIKLKKAK